LAPGVEPYLNEGNVSKENSIMSTVLVVEDSLTDKEVLTSCLKQGGIQVQTAQTAEEAFDRVKQHQFDVIILDVVLPDRSGFEICRELKAETETSKIPVIICSTKGSDMDKFWGMKQGADAYLAKPIDQEELMRTVNQLMGG
jgi:chemotaxis family two-component system response regulator PixH